MKEREGERQTNGISMTRAGVVFEGTGASETGTLGG